MNFIVKLKEGVYFDPKSEQSQTSDVSRAQKFQSKSIAKRILHQSGANEFVVSKEFEIMDVNRIERV